jgi:hypothetical protein
VSAQHYSHYWPSLEHRYRLACQIVSSGHDGVVTWPQGWWAVGQVCGGILGMHQCKSSANGMGQSPFFDLLATLVHVAHCIHDMSGCMGHTASQQYGQLKSLPTYLQGVNFSAYLQGINF